MIRQLGVTLTLATLFTAASCPSQTTTNDLGSVAVTNVFKRTWNKLANHAAKADEQDSAKQAAADSDVSRARLEDSIVVEVANLAVLQSVATDKRKEIALFLNGVELTNVFPEGRGSNSLVFHLERTPANKSVWASLLRKPFGDSRPAKSICREVEVSVGLAKGEPVRSNAILRLIVFEWRWSVILWAILFVAALIFIICLAKQSDVLRDNGPKPDLGKRPFSLARVQMASWFFLVIFSYVLIWIVTGDSDTITSSVLAMVGISTGTYFAAVAANKGGPAVPITPSHGFWIDILSEEDGITFHRFQIVVWTIVLGIMFLASVFRELRMPDFSATLLGLMGISAGTYVGFKLPVVRSATGNPAPPVKPGDGAAGAPPAPPNPNQ